MRTDIIRVDNDEIDDDAFTRITSAAMRKLKIIDGDGDVLSTSVLAVNDAFDTAAQNAPADLCDPTTQLVVTNGYTGGMDKVQAERRIAGLPAIARLVVAIVDDGVNEVHKTWYDYLATKYLNVHVVYDSLEKDLAAAIGDGTNAA